MFNRKFLLLLCSFLALAFTAARADDWHHTWTVGANPDFEFRSNDAGIDISARPGNTIEAFVETKGFHIGPNEVRITEHQDGDHVQFEVRIPSHHISFFDMTTVKITVTLPENTKLRVNTSDGHIKVDGVKAEQRLESGDGSVETTRCDGTLWVHTGDGHIDSDLTITVQGSINRNHLRGTMNGGGPLLRIHTGDGSIHLSRS